MNPHKETAKLWAYAIAFYLAACALDCLIFGPPFN